MIRKAMFWQPMDRDNRIRIPHPLLLAADCDICYNQKRGCASSVQVIQSGESPDPAKRSEQPVLSLGAEAVR